LLLGFSAGTKFYRDRQFAFGNAEVRTHRLENHFLAGSERDFGRGHHEVAEQRVKLEDFDFHRFRTAIHKGELKLDGRSASTPGRTTAAGTTHASAARVTVTRSASTKAAARTGAETTAWAATFWTTRGRSARLVFDARTTRHFGAAETHRGLDALFEKFSSGAKLRDLDALWSDISADRTARRPRAASAHGERCRDEKTARQEGKDQGAREATEMHARMLQGEHLIQILAPQSSTNSRRFPSEKPPCVGSLILAKSALFMSTSNAVKIYDTTLRDGTQGEGISFSVTDKLLIAERLDQFGVDYIEGGFPGSNPRDITFFQEAAKLKLKHAKLAAFGSTRRAGTKASEDPQLKVLLDSGMPVTTIVGKTWTLHVTEILRTTREENLAMIEDSVAYLVANGREVIHDAEHFFDGYKADPDYALRTLAAALKGGASNLTLCDTNGGTMVDEFTEIVARVVKEFGADKVGVHCHNDSGVAVALSLAGVRAGAVLVQGTINGYGERTGNADLVSIIPSLVLKMGKQARCAENLKQLRDLSLYFDELANLRPNTKAPYVGLSAFAHKGGLHANAAQKVKSSYEHIDPALVGNRTRVLVSDMAGRSSIAMKAKELGFELDEKSPAMKGLIDELKELEFRGYEFEAADASLKLLLAKWVGTRKSFFDVESYRVIVERHGEDLVAEATVKVSVDGKPYHTVAECTGPIGALDKALRLALEPVYPQLRTTTLTDFKVRILDSKAGSNARTRVLVETSDGHTIWGTVGVSDNVIDASWEALRDSVEYKLNQG